MGRGTWLGPLLLAGAACGGGRSGHALTLLEFRQKDFDSVALNEELLFYFSSDLDRSSVTSDSVRIVDGQGREVAGERSVRGNALSFLPALPCAPDLSDGGLRPGADYRVVLGGFPRPDGIRAASGALLSASLVLSFRTADVGRESPLFLDPFLGPFLLLPVGKLSNEIELEDGMLVLEYGEALDPASVPGCRFELTRFPPGASEPEQIPVVARLIENRRDHAMLLLEPSGSWAVDGSRLPPDRYFLHMPGRELRTLGGRPVEPGWPPRPLPLSVPQASVELDSGSFRELPSQPPPGCDGTATRSGSAPGLLVRYPAAAGNGRDGEVELREAPRDADLQATRIVIASEVDLSACSGPVVLRSQTSLDVRGRLVRRGAGSRHDPMTLELERADSLPEPHRMSLSTWLARLLDPEQPWSREPWTVLIAGGDIRVPDGCAIEVEGPLVLVAGGWIRADGPVLSRGYLWRTPEGGGMASHVRNALLPLALDPPLVNPLRAPLYIGAVTNAIPWTPRRTGWRTAFIGHEGAGRLSARYLQSAPRGGPERQVSDPGELGAGPVRVLVRLELPAGRGEPWDPPRFERLRLEANPRRLPAGSAPR
jgi:hypothetical protein